MLIIPLKTEIEKDRNTSKLTREIIQFLGKKLKQSPTPKHENK